MSLTTYKQDRAEQIKEARAITELADNEGRDLTADEQELFNDRMEAIKGLDEKIARGERLEKLEASIKESAGRISKPEQFQKDIHREIQRYSLVRAIRCQVEGKKLDGIEAEVSAEIAKQYGKSPEGFYMPLEQYGNLDTTTGAGAVESVHDMPEFIELLRAKMLMNVLGARVLPGLVGNVHVPRQSGGATAYWINADGSASITGSNQTSDQVPLSPSTVGASTTYTRAFLRQTSLAVEQFVRNDLATVLAIELDRVGFNGSGSGAEPEGILQNSSVSTVSIGLDGGPATHGTVVDLETDVADANADFGSLAYVTSPKGRGMLKQTIIGSNTAAKFIWENNEINGYRAFATNQIPSDLTKGSYGTDLTAILFGNFADCLYGLWSGVDVVVNPYTDDLKGAVRITMMQDCDFALRHTGSFSKCVDLETTV